MSIASARNMAPKPSRVASKRQPLKNVLSDKTPRAWLQNTLLAFLATVSGAAFYNWLSLRSGQSYDRSLCDASYNVPISDPSAIRLRGSLSKIPAHSSVDAWTKCTAARFGAAPKEIPDVLRDEFTMNGSIPIGEFYFDQAYLGGEALTSIWTGRMVEQYIRDVRDRKPAFSYDNSPFFSLFDANPDIVAEKRGVVIGSEKPWLESFLLAYGSTDVTTVEFGSISSEDSRIKTYTPDSFDSSFMRGDIEKFDYAFTYSSIEHDGLARYGDILNPAGDLLTVRKLMDIVKPGGLVFIGVPCGQDQLLWNAHRVYGPVRFQQLFAGLDLLGVFPQESRLGMAVHGVWQPIWVLRNSFHCNPANKKRDAREFLKAFKAVS